MEIKFLPAEKTLESELIYASATPDQRQHKINYYPQTIAASDELISELNDFDYIILGPLFYDNIPFEMFSRLRHKNLVLGNFGLFTYAADGQLVRKQPENVINVLPFLQYLFLDKSEAEFVSGQKTIQDCGRFFLDQGLPNMIITDGSNGSHVFSGQEYYQIPAFPPQVLNDPTGAGDTYLAAFIRAQELFPTPKEQGRFAALTATMSIEGKGAFRANLPEVLARLDKYSQ